jgi:hypothetical protein
MTSITVQDGQIVLRDGAIGTEQACCCKKCSGPCEENEDCAPGCRCVDGECVEECSGPCEENEDCAPGCRCVDGECVEAECPEECPGELTATADFGNAGSVDPFTMGCDGGGLNYFQQAPTLENYPWLVFSGFGAICDDGEITAYGLIDIEYFPFFPSFDPRSRFSAVLQRKYPASARSFSLSLDDATSLIKDEDFPEIGDITVTMSID